MWALGVRIVELLSSVTALVGQLGKQEPVERAATRGQQTGDSAITAEQAAYAEMEQVGQFSVLEKLLALAQ
ncbi:unnamed protein product [Lampetra planeri]